MRFNAPPNWPSPPTGWQPPEDWQPDASWPPAPPGWRFWIDEDDESDRREDTDRTTAHTPPTARRRSRKWLIAVAVAVALVAGAVVVNTLRDNGPPQNPDAVRLPFPKFDSVFTITSDSRGSLFAIDSPMGKPGRVLKLDIASGGVQQVLEQKPGQAGFGGLDVDSNGNLYVIQRDAYYDDSLNKTVQTVGQLWRVDATTLQAASISLLSDSGSPLDISITGKDEVYLLYATNAGEGPKNQICRVARESTAQATEETVLANVAGCYAAFGGDPGSFGVDSVHNVYLIAQDATNDTEYDFRLVKFAPGGTRTVLAGTDVGCITVAADDVVYGSDGGTKIYALKPGQSEPDTLMGAGELFGLAVGPTDSLFISDAHSLFRIPLPQ